MLQALPPHQKQEAFFNCWVRKEAYIKAIGDGLYHPLDRFDVSLSPEEPARLLRIEEDSEKASHWSIRPLTRVTGYAAALAVEDHHLRYSYWQVPTEREWLSLKTHSI
jgi:4'-phosphopantetheinyl transferase